VPSGRSGHLDCDFHWDESGTGDDLDGRVLHLMARIMAVVEMRRGELDER
jgi:hypothetical protein